LLVCVKKRDILLSCLSCEARDLRPGLLTSACRLEWIGGDNLRIGLLMLLMADLPPLGERLVRWWIELRSSSIRLSEIYSTTCPRFCAGKNEA